MAFLKTFTHTSIPIHPCTLLKKRKNNNSKMLNSPNMMPLFTGPLPVPCAGGRFSGSLAPAPRRTPCPRTLLTENICDSVQQILQLSPAEEKKKQKKKRSTHQTGCLSLLVLFLSSVLVGDDQEAWQRLLQDCSTSDAFSPRTVLI